MASSYFFLLKIMLFPSFDIRNVGQYTLTLMPPPLPNGLALNIIMGGKSSSRGEYISLNAN